MRLSLLYFAPGLIFLFWAAVHSLLANRTPAYRVIMWVLITIFLTATGDLLLGELVHSEALGMLLVQLMTPAIIPLCCIYFSFISGTYKHRPYQALWVVLPVALFTASLIITSIYGISNTNAFWARFHAGLTDDHLFYNNAERLYYTCCIVVFRWVMVAESVIMIIHAIRLGVRFHFRPEHWIDFLFKNRRMRVLEIQITLSLLIFIAICVKLFLHGLVRSGNMFWLDLLVIGISIVDFFFGYFSLFSAREFVSIPELRTAFRFNYNEENASQMAEEVILDMVGQLHGEALTHVISRLEIQAGAEFPGRQIGKNKPPTLSTTVLGASSITREEESLLTRFQHLMMDEQLFLQPGLTLSDVAERLHSNKTYVSKMVNRNYNLGFPEVLNILRVDYAEQYIRKHKDATQEDIARACGFLSASSFNSTFKRITGFTPKVWAARIESNTL